MMPAHRAEKRYRLCRTCGKPYEKNAKYSLAQWAISKYCSGKCAREAIKIRDGMTKNQRRARRLGLTRRGSAPWLEMIRARTSEAMMRPDVQQKIRAPRTPMTLSARAVRSRALVGRLPKNMMFGTNFANAKADWYETAKGTFFFRSRWEANYALYLDFLQKIGEIKDWEFEPDTFVFEEVEFGTRSYLPDFKVHNHNGSFEYHEIKGYMDGRSKTKLRRMQKYYPEVKLILIDRNFYQGITKKFGKMLHFYT